MSEIEDRLAIYDIMSRYCHAVDRQDFELARACYHDDAHDDHGRYQGDVDGLIDFFTTLGSQLESTFHMIGFPHVMLNGDVAKVITYAFYRRRSIGASEAVIQGLRYLDRFERRSGRWAIAHRTVVLDWEHAVRDEPTIPSGPTWARGAFGEADPTAAFLAAD